MKNQLFILGHRGFCDKYPENTLVSFEAAADLGVDGVELDVHQTADGHVVVIHDGTLERTTDGFGDVCETSLEDIKKLDAGSWKSPEFSGQRVPLLTEVFDLLRGRCMIYCEMKQLFEVSALVDVIYKSDMQSQVALTSFNIEYIREARRIAPELPTAMITSEALEDNTQHIRKATKLGVRVLDLWHGLLDEKVATYAKTHGMPVCGWIIDDVEAATRMLGLGIDRITTNKPDILLDFRKNIFNY